MDLSEHFDWFKQQLIEEEGFKLKPYKDTTGHLSIGVGRNLDDNGITEDEAIFLLENDIVSAYAILRRCYPVINGLNDARQFVLIDMTFNLGIKGIMSFKRMWQAIGESDFDTAAEEMMDSKWAIQVGDRSKKLY